MAQSAPKAVAGLSTTAQKWSRLPVKSRSSFSLLEEKADATSAASDRLYRFRSAIPPTWATKGAYESLNEKRRQAPRVTRPFTPSEHKVVCYPP